MIHLRSSNCRSGGVVSILPLCYTPAAHETRCAVSIMYPATGKLGCERLVSLADHGSTRTFGSKKFLFQVNWGHYCVLKDIVGMCSVWKKIYACRTEAKQFNSFIHFIE